MPLRQIGLQLAVRRTWLCAFRFCLCAFARNQPRLEFGSRKAAEGLPKALRKPNQLRLGEYYDLLSSLTNSHSTSCSASKMNLILEPRQSIIIRLYKCRVSRDVPSQLLRGMWRAPGARRLARVDWRAVLR